MGVKRKKKGKMAKPEVVYDSDDERAYKNEKVPDARDEDFYNDDVDQFHTQQEKILLDKGVKSMQPAEFSDDDRVEVMGVASDDSSDDEEVEEYRQRLKQLRRLGVKEGFQSESDDEDEDDKDQKKNDGLPDEKAWGKKRKGYYWADVSDEEDFEGGSGDEPAAADLEEKEALNLQRKMAEQLDDMDFGLGVFESMKKPEQKEREKIKADVSSLSRRAKLELLAAESPELMELLDDYKSKMTELNTRWLPLLELAKSGNLPPSQGTKYVHTKVELCLNYCVNVSFYLMLKAKHTPQLHSHPIVNRLVQYRKVMKQMEATDDKIAAEVNDLLAKVKAGEEIKLVTDASRVSVTSRLLQKAKKKEMRKKKEAAAEEEESAEEGGETSAEGGRSWGRKRKVADGLTKGEREAVEFYEALRSRKKSRPDDNDAPEVTDTQPETSTNWDWQPDAEEDLDGKRGVTYQILKNKGLQAPKKKEQRNPRVKNRMKARRQKIRRKGQIREPRTEVHRYGGEISGIRAGIKRSTKFR